MRQLYNFFWKIVLTGILVILFAFRLQDEPLMLPIIVIDAGHGGKDPGCIGTTLGTKEKDVNLAVALRLGKLLKERYPQIKIIYTRTDDKFIELNQRAAIANKAKASLFVSIHANAGPAYMCGTETYAMGVEKKEQKMNVAQRENGAILLEKGYKQKYNNFDPHAPASYILFSLSQNIFLENSLMLARLIERNFSDREERESRGVKQAGFLVLWRANVPSILIETGFLSNPTEEYYLASSLGQDEVAHDIFCAIESYNADLVALGNDDE